MATSLHLHNGLMRYLDSLQARGAPVTFEWGDYGSGRISYDNQPYVDGLLHINDILEAVLPLLPARPRPTVLAKEFIITKQQWR